jgi:hypothetical protein
MRSVKMLSACSSVDVLKLASGSIPTIRFLNKNIPVVKKGKEKQAHF